MTMKKSRCQCLKMCLRIPIFICLLHYIALVYITSGSSVKLTFHEETSNQLENWDHNHAHKKLSKDININFDTPNKTLPKSPVLPSSISSNTSILLKPVPISVHVPTYKNPRTWCEKIKWMYPSVKNFTALATNGTDILKDSQIVHFHNFSYIHNPTKKCENTRDIFILSVVKSQAEHWSLRNVIRESWGIEAVRNRNRLVFLVGNTDRPKIKRKIDHEAKQFGDIIQENFVDNYYNNTLKTVMGIRWIAKYCSKAKFILLVDDDVIVVFSNLIQFFNNTKESDLSKLFSGNLKAYIRPVRDPKFKWPMSTEEYPYDCYPTFLSGGAILTSGLVIRLFNLVMPYIKKFKYDDVYLAIMAQKLGIIPQPNSKIKMVKDVKALKEKLLIANHGYKHHLDYWRTFQLL